MEISFVVAASENNVIGIHNEMPWHLPADLKFFKRITLNKPVVMGRKTFESLGKPLPGRLNIVLSRHWENPPEGVIVFKSIDGALSYLKKAYKEISIIGGGQVFSETLPMADIIFLTRVHAVIDNGTAFFPEFDKKDFVLEWSEEHEKDQYHKYGFTIEKWVRKTDT